MQFNHLFRPGGLGLRWSHRLLLAGGVLCGLFSLAVGQYSTDSQPGIEPGIDQEPLRAPAADSKDPDGTASHTLLREGTRIQELGHFIQLTNDSAIFVDQHGRRLSLLKNLNLQRVVHMPRSTRAPDEIQWNISGVVTEFDGENYLLITRIIRKSETSKHGSPANPPAASDSQPKDPNAS